MQTPVGIVVRELPAWQSLNAAILRDFTKHLHDPEVSRSHFFGGRYENIYLDTAHVPAMATVMAQMTELARDILDCEQPLKAGFWFNAMQPGDSTGQHTHDDYDEYLSAVYYITAPANSGELLVHVDDGVIRFTPKPGHCVFFAADALHEVTRNNSTELRLSVGMNFGPARQA